MAALPPPPFVRVYPHRGSSRTVPTGVVLPSGPTRTGVPTTESAQRDLRAFAIHVRASVPSADWRLTTEYYNDLDAFDTAFVARAHYFGLLNQTLRDMPIGYRTNLGAHWFDGIPLGVLVQYLIDHNPANPNFLSGLYISGNFVDFSQRVTVQPDPSRGINELTNAPFNSYNSTQQTSDMFLNRVPLSSIQPIHPPNRTDAGDPYFIHSGLEELIEATKVTPGGSNYDCLVGFQNVWIERLHVHRVGPEPAKVLPIRTAGFGQLITRELFIPHLDAASQVLCRPFDFYVPDGRGNCFESCLRKAHLLESQDKTVCYFQNCAQSDEDLLAPMAPVYSELSATRFFDEEWKKIIQKRASDRKMRFREYQKLYAGGFPDKELRRICALLMESPLRMRVRVWQERNRDDGEFKWVDKMDMPANSSAPCLPVHIYIMMMDGRVLSSRNPTVHSLFEANPANAAKTDSSTHFVNFSHAMLIYYRTAAQYPRSASYSGAWSQNQIRDFMESKTIPFVAQLVQESVYNPLADAGEFAQLVAFQLTRHGLDLTQTSIFQKERTLSDQQMNRLRREGRNPPAHIVYVWDLETVENKQLPAEYPVYHAFQRDAIPEDDRHLPMLPVESQIPWSAQWVAVNVSDPPGTPFTVAKVEKRLPCLYYESDHPDAALRHFLLGEPHTEYGNFELGKCVEDMMKNIAIDCHERGGKIANLFAHNAHHFDHYLNLHFCRYEHERAPLNTPRGLLMMFFKVPIMPFEQFNSLSPAMKKNVPQISIRCYDTYLHFAQKLSNLGHCFNVPPQFKKLDFPIYLVNAKNCYHPDILNLTEPYGINDILSLAYIVHKMNIVYASSTWDPANPYSNRPPVCQFTTAMSIVKKATAIHFQRFAPSPKHIPKAIDIPALRQMITAAVIGGRVNAYAKTYSSPFTEDIFQAYLKDETDVLKALHAELMSTQKYMVVLDVTSLYPYAQSQYPIPTGPMRFATPEECHYAIEDMRCEACLHTYHACHMSPVHKYPDFHIVFVKNLTPPANRNTLRNCFARKIYHGASQKPVDLLYSLETDAEIFLRLPFQYATRSTQSFSNVDLFWMRYCGWTFDIVCGLAWECSLIYRSFLEPAFQQRIQAKQQGNEVLSEFLKLLYNGTYGVTAEREIKSQHVTIPLSKELWEQHLSPLDMAMYAPIRNYLKSHQQDCTSLIDSEVCDEAVYLPSQQVLVRLKKQIASASTFADLSPNHIGAAVLAYARHVMNLIMLSVPPMDISYTDTDSVCIAAHCLPALAHLINNNTDAPLGTLKNDHLKLKDGRKNGQFPCVFHSQIGTKKVKIHYTLNEEGQVHLFNTFKGFNPSLLTAANERMTPAYAQCILAKTLFNISLHGTSKPELVQHWQRNLMTGITIQPPSPQSFDSATYLGHCQGTSLYHRPHGVMEMFIPFGSQEPVDFVSEYHSDAGNYTFSRNREHVYANIYHCNPEDILDVIHKYYQGCELPSSNHATPEMETIYSTFARVSQEENH